MRGWHCNIWLRNLGNSVENVRKIVTLVLSHDFKPRLVRHFWTDFLLVCRFGKIFESTLRIFQCHVYIAQFSTVMCPCQAISYPSFGLFLYISAAILFFTIFSLSPFPNLWPMVWLIDYNILNCKKINSACLRLFQGQFPPLPDQSSLNRICLRCLDYSVGFTQICILRVGWPH